ncbi:MAG: SPFH domain-containing protein [Candidatus Methanoperedens sp.]|uniref:SPFH domain-containing protein n=1 Tax=Candidatus Methanoperedens sp. BLZ2 TaxID=2035255 RepID=UPI000BE2A1FA|nr:SPFH domain-containing protein [Candidatus Methanoperedens sp. BLZ2]KAB2947759.1 MAG: SPFH domain-containing protein [Candidatus Methanoperedens sp.]MBZ0176174.1 SPFH domain-containing protein [Candidatus Methanoperedens nitroreducens]MCX9077400.1 SPFH domain-containing protein [Candidatus Methanoperedens sp.]
MLFDKKTPTTAGSGGSILGSTTFMWDDAAKGENVIFRIPRNLIWNDNVVVREDEYAVFLRDGKILTVLDRPGRFGLSTLNIPVLTELQRIVTGTQPVAEAYYVQRRELRSKFGSAEPMVFRDQDFGIVRLRIFGQFAYKVVNPIQFITQFVGTKGFSDSDQVVSWLKGEIIMQLNDTLGELKSKKQLSVLDIPANLEEIEQMLLSKVETNVAEYGLKVMRIAELNINLPEEVQKAVDTRSGIGALGLTDQRQKEAFIAFQAGSAMRDAAKQEGGAAGAGAGAGVGLGAGMGMGMMMASQMGQTMQPQQQQQARPNGIKCPSCGADLPSGSKFCTNCGNKIGGGISCPKCKADIPAGSKFCPGCGYKIISNCPKCNAELAPGVKFCPSCGTKIE